MTQELRNDGLRLIVFDWDGTLLDSVGSIVGCTQAALEELGERPVAEGTIRAVIGLGLRESVEALCPGCDDELFHRVLETYRRHWIATYRDRSALFAGVEAALDELTAAGYLLAVATAKGRAGLDHELRTTGLVDRFVATRTMDEAPSKPHPQMLLDILDELGVTPGEALMVGDTTHDLRMAVNAGVPHLGVCTGSHSRPELEAIGPLACLEGVVELPAWLARAPIASGRA